VRNRVLPSWRFRDMGVFFYLHRVFLAVLAAGILRCRDCPLRTLPRLTWRRRLLRPIKGTALGGHELHGRANGFAGLPLLRGSGALPLTLHGGVALRGDNSASLSCAGVFPPVQNGIRISLEHRDIILRRGRPWTAGRSTTRGVRTAWLAMCAVCGLGRDDTYLPFPPASIYCMHLLFRYLLSPSLAFLPAPVGLKTLFLVSRVHGLRASPLHGGGSRRCKPAPPRHR